MNITLSLSVLCCWLLVPLSACMVSFGKIFKFMEYFLSVGVLDNGDDHFCLEEYCRYCWEILPTICHLAQMRKKMIVSNLQMNYSKLACCPLVQDHWNWDAYIHICFRSKVTSTFTYRLSPCNMLNVNAAQWNSSIRVNLILT